MVFRLPPGVQPDEFSTMLSDRFRWGRFSFGGALPAYRGGKSNALVRAFVSAIRGVGGNPTFKLKTGTSDMNIVGPQLSCPVVAYGPGDSSLDHTPFERLSLAEYATAIEVCTRVIDALSSR